MQTRDVEGRATMVTKSTMSENLSEFYNNISLTAINRLSIYKNTWSSLFNPLEPKTAAPVLTINNTDDKPFNENVYNIINKDKVDSGKTNNTMASKPRNPNKGVRKNMVTKQVGKNKVKITNFRNKEKKPQ